jgi:predicted amidophosphoribosyltransferase
VVFTIGVHEGALRRAILRYKYGGEMWWADVFARLFSDHLRLHATWFEDFDLVVSVPAYSGPGARRNWDPVGAVAERLGVLVAPLWEIQTGAVAKRVETPAMQGRTWTDRQEIATGPLRRSLVVPVPRRVAGARILVLDDVLTEGGTLREMAHVLRRAGAREVAGLVLARPVWRGRGAGGPVGPAGPAGPAAPGGAASGGPPPFPSIPAAPPGPLREADWP